MPDSGVSSGQSNLPPLEDVYVCADGTEFMVLSEHVRGEPRWYWVVKRSSVQQRARTVGAEGSTSRVKMQRLARRLAVEHGFDG